MGELDETVIREIWKPDPYVYFYSGAEVQKTLTGPSEAFTVDPESFAWFISVELAVHCPFDFYYYPFDSHACR